jgi:hypothetical protein
LGAPLLACPPNLSCEPLAGQRATHPYHSCGRAPVLGLAQVTRPGVTVANRDTPRLARWKWHGDGTRLTWRLDLVSITGMEEAASTEHSLVAVRAALLAFWSCPAFVDTLAVRRVLVMDAGARSRRV